MLTVCVLVVVLGVAKVAQGERARGSAGYAPDQRAARVAILRAFGEHSRAALSVAWCESRLHPAAIGGNNVGLFQINYTAHHLYGESWPAFVRRYSRIRENVAFAVSLSDGGTHWGAWTCQP